MENKKAFISVIVPVHNGQAYLAGCIESIERQTYQNLEVIIINDGSTDRTDIVCDEIQRTYGNVHVITMEDEGVSAARNAGLEAAKGELVTFVDADDRLLPGMLQVLYDCMADTGSDIAGCRFFLWKNEEEWKRVLEESRETAGIAKTSEGAKAVRDSKASEISSRVFTSADYVRDAVLQGNSRCWSKLYRRELIGGARFRKGLSIGEDMLFLLDLLPAAGKLAESEYAGYGYFQNPNGAINRKFTPDYMDQITCWELARENIMQMTSEQDLYIQATSHMMMGIMLTVGKLAMLPAAERKAQGKYIRICREKLKEVMAVAGAYDRLSKGYRLKVKMFQNLPYLYLLLYHIRKFTP